MTGDNSLPDGGPAGSTAALAAFAAQTPLASIPPDVVERTNDVLVDSIACLLAGYSIDLGTIAVEFARDQGGPPEARILGSDARLGCAPATFANAELMNAVDFDEVLLNWGHVVPFVFPPAIAVAERVGASGRDLLRALAIGYDVAASVTSALAGSVVLNGAPPALSARHLPVYGFSANALGAAASVGALLGLDAERMAWAFGIAGYNAPVGNAIKLTSSTPVPMTKYGCAGWIAQTGLTASLLAARGFTGDPRVLEGPYGLWRMLGSPRWAGEALVAELGSRWWIRDTSFKPYPCCRFLHHAMDLIAALVEEHRIDPDAIERIVVGLMGRAAKSPVFRTTRPRDALDATHSAPYAFAASAYGRHRFPELLASETLADPRILGLASRIELTEDPRAVEARYDAFRNDPVGPIARAPTSVEIVTSVRRYTGYTEICAGDPWDPRTRFTAGDMEQKFARCASVVLEPGAAARGLEGLRNIAHAADVRAVTALLAPSSPPCSK